MKNYRVDKLLSGQPFVKFREDPKKIPLITLFHKYLRENGKIVIEIDRLALCNSYKILFCKCYMYKFMTEPKKFITYQEGLGWSTDTGELFTFQLKHKKFFPAYHKILFTNLPKEECKYCTTQKTDIYFLCMYCCAPVCWECWEECRNYYFTGNNQFRCKICREINFWD
ncbi:hypothetical protein EBU94_05765 [bacterium]|nr:hypothetical protein [bacterium]